ncbi:MAG: hypothetical protein WBL95_08550 [Microcoleus sp.]
MFVTVNNSFLLPSSFFLLPSYFFLLSVTSVTESVAELPSCDNPSCINPEHLWAGTRSQNLLDASKKGRTQGKSHPLSKTKLDWGKVREIRKKLVAGESVKDLAQEYSVGRKTIQDTITN